MALSSYSILGRDAEGHETGVSVSTRAATTAVAITVAVVVVGLGLAFVVVGYYRLFCSVCDRDPLHPNPSLLTRPSSKIKQQKSLPPSLTELPVIDDPQSFVPFCRLPLGDDVRFCYSVTVLTTPPGRPLSLASSEPSRHHPRHFVKGTVRPPLDRSSTALTTPTSMDRAYCECR